VIRGSYVLCSNYYFLRSSVLRLSAVRPDPTWAPLLFVLFSQTCIIISTLRSFFLRPIAARLAISCIVALVVDTAKPQPEDSAIDLACGPGTVACALAQRVRHVVGLDSTLPMLEQARGFARRQSLDNVEWRAGDVYQTPFADGSFNIATCRFAFHHFENPALAFAEMVRLAATGGRVVVCDGLASEELAKAEAFNAMERRRDPSTVEFRTLPYLRRLFEAAGLGAPRCSGSTFPISRPTSSRARFRLTTTALGCSR
jgi:SAM-dependent methyltransferase